MLLKAILFGADGTLAETEELHRICFNEAFAKAGHDWEWPQELYRDLLKIPGGKERIRHYLDRIGLDIGADAAASVAALHAEKNRLYALRTKSGVALRPSVARLIAEARERGVAVATSRSNLDALLAAAFGQAGAAWFRRSSPGRTSAARSLIHQRICRCWGCWVCRPANASLWRTP